jgi:hypothetical protein
VIKSRRMRSAGHVARMGESCAYRVRVQKVGEGDHLAVPRCRWEDNIKTDLQEMGWGGMDWIGVV